MGIDVSWLLGVNDRRRVGEVADLIGDRTQPCRSSFTRAGRISLLALSIHASFGEAAFAQEALDISMAGELAARSRRLAWEQQPYSLKLGEAKMRWATSLAAEWNNNVTLVEDDLLSDVIFRPQITTDLWWPITPANVLEVSVAAGYNKYVSHDEFDRAYVLPGSAVSFDVFLRDVRLTLEDRLLYQQDPVDSALVTGTAEFGGLQNVGGVQALFDWNDAQLLASYHHLLFISSTADYEYLNRSSHQLFTQFSLQPRPELEAGVQLGLTPTSYHDSYLLDNLSYSAGAFIEYAVSPNLSVQGRGGAVLFNYDSAPGQPTASDVSNLYFEMGGTLQLRKLINLSLRGGQETQLGVNNDLVELHYVRTQVDWLFARRVSLATHFFFEGGRESGLLGSEDFKRFGLITAATWRPHRKWSARLSYQFTTRDSESPDRSYDNHRVQLQVSYQP